MKLKKINLAKRQDCNHPDISVKKSYLAQIYNNFYAGHFSKQWYGYSFNNWGNAGIQLDSIEGLWEICK